MRVLEIEAKMEPMVDSDERVAVAVSLQCAVCNVQHVSHVVQSLDSSQETRESTKGRPFQ